ncbi:MAG: hypothetical protein ABIP48_08125 [Planctomycetota bacterium]
MAVQIEKDGWKVSGSTLEELELGIAAVQRALGQTDGLPPRKPGRPPGRTSAKKAAQRKKLTDWKKVALTVLRTINGTVDGVDAGDLAESLNLKSRRSVGSPLVLTNKTLRKCQFEPASVYVKAVKGGNARWYPKQRIQEAIKAIENMKE